jgi:GDP-L-fucose synthase
MATEIVCQLTKPSGTCQKLLEISRLRDLEWQSKTSLRHDLALFYEDFLIKVKNDYLHA